MLRLGLVEVAPGKFATLQVTDDGRTALRARTPITLTQQPEKPDAKVKKRAGEIECDEALFAHLRVVRRNLADARNVPAYVIFSDVALREMARNYPTTTGEFRRIPGVGEQKLKDFSEPFLAATVDYLQSNPRQSFAPPTERREARRAVLNDSEAETLRRFRAGESIDQIARARGFVRSTILDHLARAIEAGTPLALDQFFSPAQAEEIAGAMERTGPRNLTGLRDHLGGRFEVGELRIFRSLAGRR